MNQAFGEVFRPPGAHWDQGDVVDAVYFAGLDAHKPGVLVTPACDVEQNKVDLWTFVVLYSDADVAGALVTSELESWRKPGVVLSLSKGQREMLSKRVRELLGQRLPRYHWLPIPHGENAGHVADFSCVTSVPAAEVRATAQRIATLASSWREQLPARYASYMARVGTADFRSDDVDAEVERLVRSITSP